MKNKINLGLLGNFKEHQNVSYSLNDVYAKVTFKNQDVWGHVYLGKRRILTVYLAQAGVKSELLSHKAYYLYIFSVILVSWGLAIIK